jgi:hypothetical protein
VSIGPVVWSIIVVLVALVVLALLVLGLLRAVGRTTVVVGAFTKLVSDRTGMLRARIAALQIRMARRREQTGDSSGSLPVESGTTVSDLTVPVSEGAPQ